MSLKVQLQEKHPHLDFSNFNVEFKNQKGLITCPKHGSYYKEFSESIRQKFCCNGCMKIGAVKPKVINRTCKIHGDYSHGRYDSTICKKCLNLSRLYPLENLKPIFKSMGLNQISEYKGLYHHVIFETLFGKVKAYPNSIKRLQVPTIMSAVDKTEYSLREYKLMYNSYYTYPNYRYVDSKFKFVAICPKHGEFITNYSNHKIHKCKGCAYDDLDIGFTKDSFIRVAGKRLSTLYLVELLGDVESILKIGITCRGIKDRLHGHKYKIISEVVDADAGYIYDLEKSLHNKLSKYNKVPIIRFSGYTECYDTNSIKQVLNEFRSVQRTSF